MMDGGMNIGTLAEWVAAVATFLAVLVALRLHTRVFPPKLTLKLRSEDGEATKAILSAQQNGVIVETSERDARYYHVMLSNERPWFVATDVDVYLVSVKTKDANDQYAEIWSGSLPMVASHYGIHPNRTLGADPREYDLCAVVRDKWLELPVRIVPNNFPNKIRVGEGASRMQYLITCQARSLEAVSPRISFTIAWDGQWNDDTIRMRQHMVVRQSA
jgi:hypothetical protein